jgi:hypothetical protein
MTNAEKQARYRARHNIVKLPPVSTAVTPTYVAQKRWRQEPVDANTDFELWFKEWVVFFLGLLCFQTQLRAFRITVKHRRVIILIPREHGKTFFVYLLLAWLLLEHPFWDHAPMCLYFSANRKLVKSCSAWFDRLFNNRKIQAVYGNVLNKKLSNQYSKYFRDDLRSEAQKDANLTIAMDANITGLHVDVLVFDDILDEKCRRKPSIIEDWIAWYSQNAGDTLNRGGFEVIIGTRKMKGDFYEHVLNLHALYAHVEKAVIKWGDYKTFIDENGIKRVQIENLADFQILWNPKDIENGIPKWDVLRIIQKLLEKGKLFFSCEYMNDPASEQGVHFDRVDFDRARFRIDTLPGQDKFLYRDDGKTFPLYELTAGGFTITMDPTRGNSEDGDYAAIIAGCAYLGQYYIFEAIMLKDADPSRQCYELLRLYQKFHSPTGDPPRVLVEHIAGVGDDVLAVINAKGLYVEEIKSQTQKKLGRILWGIKEPIKQRAIWWALHIEKPYWEAMVEQFLGLGVSDKTHDDGPDAVEMFVSNVISMDGVGLSICSTKKIEL